MKTWKKGLAILTLVSLGVVGGAKIVQADSIDYHFRLPVTGTKRTNGVTKTDDGNLYNEVRYIGRPDYRIDYWGMSFKTDQDVVLCDITPVGSFTGLGWNSVSYTGGGARWNGKTVFMAIKTGPTTWVEVDVNGVFLP